VSGATLKVIAMICLMAMFVGGFCLIESLQQPGNQCRSEIAEPICEKNNQTLIGVGGFLTPKFYCLDENHQRVEYWFTLEEREKC